MRCHRVPHPREESRPVCQDRRRGMLPTGSVGWRDLGSGSQELGAGPRKTAGSNSPANRQPAVLSEARGGVPGYSQQREAGAEPVRPGRASPTHSCEQASSALGHRDQAAYTGPRATRASLGDPNHPSKDWVGVLAASCLSPRVLTPRGWPWWAQEPAARCIPHSSTFVPACQSRKRSIHSITNSTHYL